MSTTPTGWTDGNKPAEPGWYAVVQCWDPEEGLFPDAALWLGDKWAEKTAVVSHAGPFADRQAAEDWADEHDPEGA
jgi:hypothetical protein